jgi:hypothetical protein
VAVDPSTATGSYAVSPLLRRARPRKSIAELEAVELRLLTMIRSGLSDPQPAGNGYPERQPFG